MLYNYSGMNNEEKKIARTKDRSTSAFVDFSRDEQRSSWNQDIFEVSQLLLLVAATLLHSIDTMQVRQELWLVVIVFLAFIGLNEGRRVAFRRVAPPHSYSRMDAAAAPTVRDLVVVKHLLSFGSAFHSPIHSSTIQIFVKTLTGKYPHAVSLMACLS